MVTTTANATADAACAAGLECRRQARVSAAWQATEGRYCADCLRRRSGKPNVWVPNGYAGHLRRRMYGYGHDRR